MTDQLTHTRKENFMNTNTPVQLRMANDPCSSSPKTITFICFS